MLNNIISDGQAMGLLAMLIGFGGMITLSELLDNAILYLACLKDVLTGKED